MTAPTAVLVLTWLSLTAYALLAGADFGAGVWDLVAGSASGGRRRRTLIEHVIGPVWEANHVWLIFVLVLLWTAFPPVFAAVASTEWIPLTLAALGIIGRGSAFAFRKTVAEVWQQRLFGAAFAVSSLATPFFLGTVAGAVATGRVPRGIATGDVWHSWTGPLPLLTGALAVAACAFLAATYLCGDAVRSGEAAVAEWFRRCAIGSGLLAGTLSLAGVAVARADAGRLYDGLTGRALPLVAVSALGGVGALLLVLRRRYVLARVAAALAVVGVVWGWGVAQHPQLLPGLDVSAAAAVSTTLHAVLVTSLIGLAVLVPAMCWLFQLFTQGRPQNGPPSPTSSK